MAYNLRSAGREQQFLMAPSFREWLPEGHLAWFVLDVVEQLDLSAFYARYRSDGRGGAAYKPAAMVARREKPRRARILRTMDTMRARLASDEGRALYRQRSQIIEPVFGQMKDGRGFRRFSRRGAVACASEWKLMAVTHNLLKLRRHRAAVLTA